MLLIGPGWYLKGLTPTKKKQHPAIFVRDWHDAMFLVEVALDWSQKKH